MRTPPRSAVVISLVAVAMLGACAQSAGSPDQEGPIASGQAPIPIRSAGVLPSGGAPVTGEVPEAILSAIFADAVERTGATEDEITVTRGEAVTWNDGSLGCPEPDMAYTQALIDGYHVVLDIAGETLDYRVGSGSNFRLCENPIEGGG